MIVSPSQSLVLAPTAQPNVFLAPQAQANAKNLIQDVQAEGCIRLWKPQSADPTKMPNERQPGLAGVYLLTPLSTGSFRGEDLPTYLLTPSGTIRTH